MNADTEQQPNKRVRERSPRKKDSTPSEEEPLVLPKVSLPIISQLRDAESVQPGLSFRVLDHMERADIRNHETERLKILLKAVSMIVVGAVSLALSFSKGVHPGWMAVAAVSGTPILLGKSILSSRAILTNQR